MKYLKETQVRRGLFELSELADVSVEDLKKQYETTVENMSGKNAIFLGDDREQLQTMALEKLFKVYRKPLQFRKFLNKETAEDKEEAEVITDGVEAEDD